VALCTDTGAQRIDTTATVHRFPIRLTRLEAFVRRRMASSHYGHGRAERA
jgi:hypothetical protein